MTEPSIADDVERALGIEPDAPRPRCDWPLVGRLLHRWGPGGEMTLGVEQSCDRCGARRMLFLHATTRQHAGMVGLLLVCSAINLALLAANQGPRALIGGLGVAATTFVAGLLTGRYR